MERSSLIMYVDVESEVLGWTVCCVMYDKAKYACKLFTCTQRTVHPMTSDSTSVYIYKHGWENKATSLHCYVASVLNA